MHYPPCYRMPQLSLRLAAPECMGGHRGEGGTYPRGSGAGPHPSVPAAWTQTRTATRRSWLLLSACARAASAPGQDVRRLRLTLSRCTRACWCCAASPVLGMPRGHPHPEPSPSTLSPSACLLAAPASCPGWHDDCQLQLSSSPRDHGRGSPPRLDSGDLSVERAPPIYVYLLVIYMP